MAKKTTRPKRGPAEAQRGASPGKAVKPKKARALEARAASVAAGKHGVASQGQAAPAAKATAKRPAIGAPVPEASRAQVLDRLWSVVLSRRDADPSVSHSARLLSRGTAKVAQKFGEEAVECLIEALTGNRAALVAESADVLYHLLVMWVDAGVRPQEVWQELERREGVSGVAEKAARRRTPVATRKIP